MTGWAIEALIASTLLMAGVLLVRAPVRRAFGPQIAYALWALPLLRLLLPPMPSAWREVATPISRAGETITVLVIEPLAGSAAAAASPDIPSLGLVLAVLWALGAAAFLLWHAVRYARFCRRMLAGRAVIDRVAGVHVIASDGVPGPLAFGILRRYVAFPRDFDARYDAAERDLALAHELGHHARGDLIANWAALIILALHWFDPIAWIAFRAFRADQEMANDARVLAGRGAADRHAYACAIVKSAHGGAVSAACHLHTINDLKGRLKMLGSNHASRRRLTAGAAVISLVIVGGLGLTASGSATAAAITAHVADTVGVDLAQADLTPPPAPPPVPPVPGVAPLPPRAPLPPLPPRPRAFDGTEDVSTVTTHDGKVIRKRVIRIKDGKVLRNDWQGMEDIPEVSALNCDKDGRGGVSADNMVVRKTEGGKKIIVICSDRIARKAAEGAEMAANGADIQRHAMMSARDSLRAARAAIESGRNLSEEQRREALAGLDEAQAEIEADAAKGE